MSLKFDGLIAVIVLLFSVMSGGIKEERGIEKKLIKLKFDSK